MAKNFPLDAGLLFAHVWNQTYCEPPLPEGEFEDIIKEGYATWRTRGRSIPDEEPEQPPSSDEDECESLSVEEIYDAPDPKMLVDGLIEENAVTFICGPPGHGKTWLAIKLCKCLAISDPSEMGERFLDFEKELPAKKILYCDKENGVSRIKQRMKSLSFSRGNPNFRLFKGRKLMLDNPKDLKKLLKHMAKIGANYIVFDSLRRFHSKDENKSEQMDQLGDIFKEFFLSKGIGVLCIHHDVKNGLMVADQDRTRGSGDITGFAESVLGLMKDRETGVYMLTRRKVRGAPDDGPGIPFSLVPGEGKDEVLLSVEAAKERLEEARQKKSGEQTQKVKGVVGWNKSD
jgi:archaellum biogenesis ATPase FlaH